jgi:hypothetical protein
MSASIARANTDPRRIRRWLAQNRGLRGGHERGNILKKFPIILHRAIILVPFGRICIHERRRPRPGRFWSQRSRRSRDATFKKRRQGLFKKAYELGVLTGKSTHVFIEDSLLFTSTPVRATFTITTPNIYKTSPTSHVALGTNPSLSWNRETRPKMQIRRPMKGPRGE